MANVVTPGDGSAVSQKQGAMRSFGYLALTQAPKLLAMKS